MRVPLNFDYPLNKTWEGYLNPFYKKCSHCENGYTNARIRLQDLVSLLMLSGSDSVKGTNHPYFDHIGRFVYGFNSAPSKDMSELTTGLSGRDADRLFGHDACDRWSAEKKIIEAAGLNAETWGICEYCKGEAIDPEIKEQYEAWKEFEPPTGNGYQLWETTSEGSPQSPVFNTLEELCEWCQDNATTFGSNKTTKENWMKMLNDDFVSHQEGNVVFI